MTEGPHVLMVTPYPPKLDGLATYAVDLIAALKPHVARIDVATQRPRHRTNGPVAEVLSGHPWSVVRLVRLIDARRPDIVHLQFTVPAWGIQTIYLLAALAVARSRSRVRIVITLHEVVREVQVLRTVGVVLFRILCRLADHVVVHSAQAADVLRQRCGAEPGRLVRMPHGVPSGAETAVDASSSQEIVYFGYIHPDKGIEHLIAAFAALDRPDAGLTLVGRVRPRSGIFRLFQRHDDAYLIRLRDLAGRVDARDRIRFAGFLDAADLQRILAGAAAVVLPYLDVTQSGAANRALAAGVPIIASDLPGLREDLAGAAVLIPPGDVPALATALQRLLTDEAEPGRLRAAVRVRRAELDVNRVAADLADCYASLLERTR